MLHLVRDLIALRRRERELTSGSYEQLPAPAGAWAWRRGDAFAVALNLSGAEVTVDGVGGPRRCRRPTARVTARRSQARVALGPYEGVTMELER